MLFPMQFYSKELDCTKGLTGVQFLVLLGLAKHASRALGECYPGVKRVAEFAHQTPRNTQKHINALIARGHVRVLEGQGQPVPRGATNLYQLGVYREHIGLKRFDDGQGLAKLISSTLMDGMKPDAARAFEYRRVIELTASKYNTPITPDVLSSLGAFLNEQKYIYGQVHLNPGTLQSQLEKTYFIPTARATPAPAPSRELPDVSSSTAGTPSDETPDVQPYREIMVDGELTRIYGLEDETLPDWAQHETTPGQLTDDDWFTDVYGGLGKRSHPDDEIPF